MESHALKKEPYRTRLAPTPSGYLHLGHAATFLHIAQRAQKNQGKLIFRLEDIDPDRNKKDYCIAALEDLHHIGLKWDEGPDIGGDFAPYQQSQCLDRYRRIAENLCAAGFLYESPHSRTEIQNQKNLQKGWQGETLFPPALRQKPSSFNPHANWRFRVPDNTPISFTDQQKGPITFTAGEDFGDFLVWRKKGWPSYELAVVCDDHYMKISEVIRGEDLLLSTARQLLIYQALNWDSPDWVHLPLIYHDDGTKLSKSQKAPSLRSQDLSKKELFHILDTKGFKLP